MDASFKVTTFQPRAGPAGRCGGGQLVTLHGHNITYPQIEFLLGVRPFIWKIRQNKKIPNAFLLMKTFFGGGNR